MTALPNAMVPLVGQDGRPTASLLEILPNLSAQDVLVTREGLPTPLFIARLRTVSRVLPNGRAPLTNRDGTPTRTMTHLLMALA